MALARVNMTKVFVLREVSSYKSAVLLFHENNRDFITIGTAADCNKGLPMSI